jgi:predicted small lipoprotein YifL/cytoskeletal protein CcmA (bactofilin family)
MMKKLIYTMIVSISVLALAACGGSGDDEAAEAGESAPATTADATSRPTQMTADAGNVQDALGPDGSWIVIFTDDVTVGEELTVAGEVYEEEGADAPRRKIALYEQDADRNVTARHTLTTPRLIIEHENTRIQSGEVAGDVFVNAAGFELTGGGTINGNLYFASEEFRDGANITDDSTVMGEIRIGSPADAVSRPTQLTATDAASVDEALGVDGPWIILFEGDVSVDSDVVIVGAVYEEAGAEAPRRKLALYAQDADRNVTARYTLSAPRVIVHHLNTRVQAGTIAGDVYVEEEGFELTSGATIDGDLSFADEALQASSSISDDSTVTGEVRIGSVD